MLVQSELITAGTLLMIWTAMLRIARKALRLVMLLDTVVILDWLHICTCRAVLMLREIILSSECTHCQAY